MSTHENDHVQSYCLRMLGGFALPFVAVTVSTLAMAGCGQSSSGEAPADIVAAADRRSGAVESADTAVGTAIVPAGVDAASKQVAMDTKDQKPKRVVKTDEEWRKQLTAMQYRVTRRHDTEPAFRNEFWNNKREGIYQCVCCGAELFESKTKFDSGTGWPSFYQPMAKDRVGTQRDKSLFAERVEVHCSRCDAHLGHVFDDAIDQPTGLRYCINSAALKFIEQGPHGDHRPGKGIDSEVTRSTANP
jgi:peptide-methionine (R)-S-oxide reductase